VPYVYAEWKQCKAGLDYHVEVAKHSTIDQLRALRLDGMAEAFVELQSRLPR
jgi:hypothetical protein